MSAHADCAKKWEFKYIHKQQESTGLAMKIGSTNHAVLESVNKWIRDKKTSPDKKYFNDAIDSLVKLTLPLEDFKSNAKSAEEEKLSEEEFCSQQREETKSQLKKMCELYIEKAEQDFKEVILVEKDHILNIADVPFKMVTDAVIRHKDGSLRVLDYKTKGKSSTDVAILQLVSYGVGVEDILSERVGGLEQWDFIKKKNPEIKIHQVDMTKYNSYRRVLEEELQTFWKNVHAGFFPRNLRSMFCGPDKCAFWEPCMNPGALESAQQTLAEFHDGDVKNLSTRRR